jgi:hypothetical protein
MAFRKFLGGLFKSSENKSLSPGDVSEDTSRAFTAENVFDDLLENLDKPVPKIEPLHPGGKPVVALPNYIPKEDEKKVLEKRIADAAENHQPDLSDEQTNVEPADPLAYFGGSDSKKEETLPDIDPIDALIPSREPWPETPLVDVMPQISSLAPSVQQPRSETDSDIFYPVGHPGLHPPPALAIPDSDSIPYSGDPLRQLEHGVPPVPGSKLAPGMGSPTKVGWGLRLAARLAATNRNPTPSPDALRSRVQRRSMSDSELIPPLNFQSKNREGSLL